MKILITGSTGLLGSNLAIRLNSSGHEVIGLGRNSGKGRKLSKQGITFFQCDLNNKKKLQTLPDDIDIIVHSAALSAPWGKKELFTQSNVVGTKSIVDLAINLKVKKFIHVSSPSLYFKFEDKLNITENDSIEPPHPSQYTSSKYYAEKCVNDAVKNSNLNAITIRPRGIFGPEDESILPRIVELAKANKLKQIGEGKNLVDITYVDNVSQAIELIIISDKDLKGEKFNITNDEPISQWGFINDLLQQLNITQVEKSVPYFLVRLFATILEFIYKVLPISGEPRLTRYTVGLLYFNQTLDISKAKELLSFKPEVSMNDGVEKVIKWWKEDENRN